MKLFDIHHRSAERLSQRLLYLLVGLACVLFGLYYLVGFDHAYIENPDFNEPLLTPVLLVFTYVLLAVAVGAAVWALLREVKRRSSESKVVNGIPTALISRCVAGGTLLVFILTFALASTKPVVTNGKLFTDTLLLRVADQFIFTAMVLLLVAAVAVGYGMTRYYRKQNSENADTKTPT